MPRKKEVVDGWLGTNSRNNTCICKFSYEPGDKYNARRHQHMEVVSANLFIASNWSDLGYRTSLNETQVDENCCCTIDNSLHSLPHSSEYSFAKALHRPRWENPRNQNLVICVYSGLALKREEHWNDTCVSMLRHGGIRDLLPADSKSLETRVNQQSWKPYHRIDEMTALVNTENEEGWACYLVK